MGCKSGLSNDKRGCYGDCYSAKSAKLYGYDFSTTVLRHFESAKQKSQIVKQVMNIDMPFIRMGSSGDPSENWDHTLDICEVVQRGLANAQLDLFGDQPKPKEIVIITKHWTNLSEGQLQRMGKYGICVNTSVSAIDTEHELSNRIHQFRRIAQHCKSYLRIVSFDFNIENEQGFRYSEIQSKLFQNSPVIDTVFRPDKNNPLVTSGMVNTTTANFMGKKTLVSQRSRKTFLGVCGKCPEMCGTAF
jgi:hypothetical protein